MKHSSHRTIISSKLLRVLLLALCCGLMLLSATIRVNRLNAAEVCQGTPLHTVSECECELDDNLNYSCNCANNDETGSCEFKGPAGCVSCFTPDKCTVKDDNSGCIIQPGTEWCPEDGCTVCEDDCDPYCRGDWYGCTNSCGDGTEYQNSWCVADCGNTVTGTRCSQDCCVCDDGCTCTLCGASCGSWCGYKTVTGKRCCNESCVTDCTYDCGCNRLAPSAPGLIAPANETAFSNVPHVDLSWNLNGTNCGGGNGWGASCPEEDKRFQVTVQTRGALDTDFHGFTQIEAIKQALLGTRWKKSVQSVSICVP